MARATVKIPINRLNSDEAVKYCGRQESVVDLIFGFLEEGDVSTDSSCNSCNSSNYGGSLDDMDVDDESVDNNANSVEEDKAFWESKGQLLQEALCRTTSIETKIRNATKEAMRELSLGGIACTCRRPTTESCQNCLQREISDRLRKVGYNCAICKSKWRSSPDIPKDWNGATENLVLSIAVLVRCFVDRKATENQITGRLGDGFSRAPFATVVALCTAVSVLAILPLGELFFFHMILIRKGITTYEYVVALRVQSEPPGPSVDGGDQQLSLPSSPTSSAVTAISGRSSVGIGLPYKGAWCTPPRIFMDHQDEIIPHLQPGRLPSTVDPDAIQPDKGKIPQRPVRISAWKLAKLDSNEAIKAGAKARASSSVLRPECLTSSTSRDNQWEHTYLEVLDNSNSKKKELRVVIELNFRAEFEMAKANEEYNRLIFRLPEVFVGKPERLQALIKILCSAAKKCMKDKKMHMGPWRKHKYMQAKWFGECERTVPLILSGGFSGQLPKPRASMLTFNLIENLPVLKCTAVN
ncbi:unnamed protein product [Camellia sinensis]